MTEEKEELSLKLFVVLSRAYRSLTDYTNKFIQEKGLNPTEFAVLELLYHKGDQPLQQIGDKILLASGSITYVVDKLEKKQLLQRVACPNDRRVTYAQITEQGIQLIKDLFPEHKNRIDEILMQVDEHQKKEMIEVLKAIGKSVPKD